MKVLPEEDDSMRRAEMLRFRRVAFFAVVFSTVTILGSILVFPIAHQSIQRIQSSVHADFQFCKIRNRDLWSELLAVSMLKTGRERVRRDDAATVPDTNIQDRDRTERSEDKEEGRWLFGHFVKAADLIEKAGESAEAHDVRRKEARDRRQYNNDNGRGYNAQPLSPPPQAAPPQLQCCPCVQGPAGPPGNPGADGRDGADGMAGEDGSHGSDSPPVAAPTPEADAGGYGVAHAVAACSNECPPGPPGPAGQAGDRGPKGYPGAQGAPGAPGKEGVKGPPGKQGPPGPPGYPGRPGDKGESGKHIAAEAPPGPPGRPGPMGPPGPNGPPGPKGRPGAPGSQGTEGDMGNTGAYGKPGPAGPPGPNGTGGPPGSCSHCPKPRTAPGY